MTLANQKIIDHNYNVVVTTNDNEEYLLFADRLHNEGLDHWKDWQCAAGYSYLVINPDFDVYGSVCENDYLGNLDTSFKLLESYTTCSRDRCIMCTDDLSVTKYKIKK